MRQAVARRGAVGIFGVGGNGVIIRGDAVAFVQPATQINVGAAAGTKGAVFRI